MQVNFRLQRMLGLATKLYRLWRVCLDPEIPLVCHSTKFVYTKHCNLRKWNISFLINSLWSFSKLNTFQCDSTKNTFLFLNVKKKAVIFTVGFEDLYSHTNSNSFRVAQAYCISDNSKAMSISYWFCAIYQNLLKTIVPLYFRPRWIVSSLRSRDFRAIDMDRPLWIHDNRRSHFHCVAQLDMQTDSHFLKRLL